MLNFKLFSCINYIDEKQNIIKKNKTQCDYNNYRYILNIYVHTYIYIYISWKQTIINYNK